MRVRHVKTEVQSTASKLYSFEAVDCNDVPHANLWVLVDQSYSEFGVELLPASGLPNDLINRALFLSKHVAIINWELVLLTPELWK